MSEDIEKEIAESAINSAKLRAWRDQRDKAQHKQRLADAVHAINVCNYDQTFTITKKEIFEHLIKELGL